jgi:serine/threonine kinase 32
MEKEELEQFCAQMLSALSYLHDQNIVHLDIRPQSVLLDEAFNLKLTNFTKAKVVEGAFQNEKQTSLLFRAPEFFTETQLTAKVDVWATGVLFYYMASFRYPFPGETASKVNLSIKSNVPLNIPLFIIKKPI